jgi:hypothetical protein
MVLSRWPRNRRRIRSAAPGIGASARLARVSHASCDPCFHCCLARVCLWRRLRNRVLRPDCGHRLVRRDRVDGSLEPEFRGNGEFSRSHSYDGARTAATIAVQVIGADGTIAGATVDIDLGGSVTTSNPTSTTSTSTTVPVSTTTTAVTITTTASTTTTTRATTTSIGATTTTIEAEPESVRLAIDVASGYIDDRWGGGALQSDWDGSTADVRVQRHNDSWEEDGIVVRWDVPQARYEELIEGASGLEFSFTADVRIDYELDTDASDGNEAKLDIRLAGHHPIGSTGDTFNKDIGEDDHEEFVVFQPLQAGWSVDDPKFPVVITLELICAAKGPGGIAHTSDSECTAEVSFVGEFDLTVVAVP